MIDVNVGAITYLTKKFGTELASRKKRSAIINLGSIASVSPKAFFSVYSGGKAYDHRFSMS
jgi:short-subunit dehydrogenase